jgi:PAS domain S-box-containing protein
MSATPYKPFIKITAVITIVAGLLVIIGWFAGNENLKSVVAGLETMKFNSAICFILSGVSLLFQVNEQNSNRNFKTFLCSLIMLFSLLTLAEYIFNINTGLDELFVTDYTARNNSQNFPGRMAVGTVYCFLLIGLAFIAMSSSRKNVKLAAQYFLHLVTLISVVALTGYLYDIPIFYKLSFPHAMALNTSVLFLLLSITSSLVNPSLGFSNLFTGKSTGSIMARSLFPMITIIILALGFLLIKLRRAEAVSEGFGVALFFISFIIISLLLIKITAEYLDKADNKRSEAEISLYDLNANLKQLVYEKTSDLQQITERLSLATKASKIGIWDWDITNNILTWDDRMYELYGITPSTFSGAYKAWENAMHPSDRKSGSLAIEMAISGEKEFDTEFRVVWPDKSVHYMKANSHTQRDAAGKAFRMTGTNWDITDRIMMQKKLAYEKEQNQKAILKTAIESQETERNQIGSELHDNVNQLLAAANIHLSLIKKGNELDSFELINESKNLIKKAVDEIHKLTHNIDTSHLDDIGLAEAVKLIIAQINSLHIIKIKLNQTVEGVIIPTPVALTAYRIIQEQLNNILTHAAATEVRIQLHAINDLLKLDIADNGKGADFSNIKRGMGLSNMQNRAKAYNGKVDFFTSPGNGFTVVVEIAITQPE